MSQMDLNGNNANSSDFVKKLYKMLEDKTHEDVVRWGDQGDSFVVLENEKFTKSILPKNFKHSNFASFVRQLNKYDFHKVRQNNEDNSQSSYAAGAWEFKHPDFKANNKEALDNIKRKAPAPRKANETTDDAPTNHAVQQIDLIQTQLLGTQHQLQNLQDKYDEMTQNNFVLLQQVVQLQRVAKNHAQVMHRIMPFLFNVDEQRRTSLRAPPFANGNSGGMGIADLVVHGQDDHPASPLQQASQLLDEFNAENLVNKELEQRAINFSFGDRYSTPPEYASSVTMAPTSGGSSTQMGFAHISHPDPLDSVVYPMGHTNGIDPIDSQHYANIPYSLPANGVMTDPQSNEMIKPMGVKMKKNSLNPGWGIRKPRVLLVEDDLLCVRIGTKFLAAFDCITDVAPDGGVAVDKVIAAPSYDIVLMDIIMPRLDGISATYAIRNSNSEFRNTPIIAMTSNIRSEDIDVYFRWGMNDVLPKPFTKEGMLRTLEKHLFHLKKDYTGPMPPDLAQVQNSQMAFHTPVGSAQPLNLNISHLSGSAKDDGSPGKSPSSANNWHSPGQMGGASPQSNVLGSAQHYGAPLSINTGVGMSVGPMSAGGFNLTPTHSQIAQGGVHFQTPPGVMTDGSRQISGHRRGMSDMDGMMSAEVDEHPDVKRQRIYPQPPVFPQ